MMDYKGCKCASCHKVLKEGDDIVICPECGAPYHRECYAAEGRCVFSAKHGKGFEYVPPEAKPDVNANGPICPVCHAQNPPDTLFCERCGQPMRGGVPPQAAQSSPQYAEPGMSGTGMPGGFGGPGAQYATGDVMTQLHLAKEYDGISTQDWMKYIGNSAPYYLYQFQRMDESGRKTSFCWSALFIPEFYFFYRKMWKQGLLATLVMVVLSIPGFMSIIATFNPTFFGSLPLGWLPAAYTIGEIGIWAFKVILGMFAVSWYHDNSKAQIEEIYMACPEGDGRTELLVQRGGTNLLAALLYFGIMCLLQVAILYMAGPSAIQYLMTMAGA